MNQRLVKAAKAGNIYAILGLAYGSQYGIDRQFDPEKAIQLYKTSANMGCARAKWELAKIYRDGEIVEPNPYEFIHWLTAAADAEIPEAMMDLALRYIRGVLVMKDLPTAYSWIKKVAALGYPQGEFYLGIAYLHGTYLAQNLAESDKYLRRAREHGNAEFYLDMGRKLEFGLEGVELDLQMAKVWYKYAADMGSDKGVYSYLAVDRMLKGGKYETPEERERAMMRLPSVTEEVLRTKLLNEADQEMSDQNYAEAVEKYEKAGDLGNPDALYMLAILYHEGEVVRRSDERSYGYLERAAIAGSTDANMELGRIYEEGRGRKADRNEAIRHYAAAVAGGNLLGYYELSRFMEHPEKYVREHHKIVRRWGSGKSSRRPRPAIPTHAMPSATSITVATGPKRTSRRRSNGSTSLPDRAIRRVSAMLLICSSTQRAPTPIWTRPCVCTRFPPSRDTSFPCSIWHICIRTVSVSHRTGTRRWNGIPRRWTGGAFPLVTVSA